MKSFNNVSETQIIKYPLCLEKKTDKIMEYY